MIKGETFPASCETVEVAMFSVFCLLNCWDKLAWLCGLMLWNCATWLGICVSYKIKPKMKIMQEFDSIGR